VLKTGTGLTIGSVTIGSAGVGDCKERSRTSFCDAGVCAAGTTDAGAGAGVDTGAGVTGVATGAGATGAGVATGAGATAGVATEAGVTGVTAAFGVGGVPPRGAPAIGALVEEDEEELPEEFGLYVLKNSIQVGSSEVGSDK